MRKIPIEVISESSVAGWEQERRSDYFDIKLKEGFPITKIEILDESNVFSFYIKTKDINEFEQEKKVFFDSFLNLFFCFK